MLLRSPHRGKSPASADSRRSEVGLQRLEPSAWLQLRVGRGYRGQGASAAPPEERRSRLERMAESRSLQLRRSQLQMSRMRCGCLLLPVHERGAGLLRQPRPAMAEASLHGSPGPGGKRFRTGPGAACIPKAQPEKQHPSPSRAHRVAPAPSRWRGSVGRRVRSHPNPKGRESDRTILLPADGMVGCGSDLLEMEPTASRHDRCKLGGLWTVWGSYRTGSRASRMAPDEQGVRRVARQIKA